MLNHTITKPINMKQGFYIFLLIVSLVMTSAFVTSCKDDDDNDGGGETKLTITSIDPVTARVGETININGTGFSTNKTLNAVQFTRGGGTSSETSAVVTEATATRLTVEVPAGAGDGPITVTVGEKTATSSQNFILDTSLGAPELTNIDPANGYMGIEVTITGKNFGTDVSVVKVYFNETEVPEITSITNTTIVTRVPSGLEVGDATIKVVREEVESSNTLTFTVNKIPTSVKTVYWTSSGVGIYKGVINESGAAISKLYDDSGVQGIEVDTEEGYIYWGNGSGQILKASVSGEGPVETLYEGLGGVADIAVDKTLNKIFILSFDYTNFVYEYIYSANLDGTSDEMQTLYTANFGEAGVYDVKLVVSENKLYWTESAAKRVMVGSVNGSTETEATVLFDADDELKGPTGVAIDKANSKIYIVDNGSLTGTASSTVFSGNLSGGTLSVLVEPGDNVNRPSDAEIDLDNGYLFWINTDPGEVMRVKLDGSNVETLFDGLSDPIYFDLDIH